MVRRMADRGEYIKALNMAAAQYVLAKTSFQNAVIAARKAGVSDSDMAITTGLPEAEIAAVLNTH